MGNDDSNRRKGAFKGSVEREVVKQWLTPTSFILGIFLGLSVTLVLPKWWGFLFCFVFCFFGFSHMAMSFQTGHRLKSQ